MSDKLKEAPSSRDSTMEAKNTVEIPLTSSDGKEEEGTTPKKRRGPNLDGLDWDVLRSYRGALKLAQIVVGIVVLGLEYPRAHLSVAEYILFFVTLNVTFVTFVVLLDSLLKKRFSVENTFGAKLWPLVELRFTCGVALVLHCLAFWTLMGTINLWWITAQRALGSVFAFVASALYFADWWRLFSGRSAPKTVEQITVS
ncbi:uncharacterized protein LOC129726378 [Wyeomyia smithii]|uniref:uncharacterized protein LOC129726378 n=1 Tax=Wyeomyia smithii TaxID=174621 RepID=UPI002467BDA4|nr:uncharacterized protein LOC129726378 [Wyeomyia smithii]